MSRMLFGAAAIAAMSGTALAGFTTVNTNSNTTTSNFGGGAGATGGGGGERSVVEILSRMYSGLGSFSVANTTGTIEGDLLITNGSNTITARRVHDNIANTAMTGNATTNILNLATGSFSAPNTPTALDGVWSDGTVTAMARARYAGNDQVFGYTLGTAATNFSGTTVSVAQGFDDGGPGNMISIGSSSAFQWMRQKSNGTNQIWSFAENNANDNDRMVAWEILGFGSKRYVLAFEDINPGGDQDYNDLVIEIDLVIPLPHASGMALAGLGILGLRRRRA